MRLAALLEDLKADLVSDSSQKIFAIAKREHPDLQEHSTLPALLAVLRDSKRYSYELRNKSFRALVSQAQSHPRQRLWGQILFYVLLPGLITIRKRTAEYHHDPHDIDATLWTAFFQVLHSYPLRRKGSVPASLLLDTRKRYFKILRDEQDLQRSYNGLIEYADHFSDAGFEHFDLADHQERTALQLDEDDVVEMRKTLLDAGVTEPDIDLLWGTDIEGQTIPQFMRAKGLTTGDLAANKAEAQRLKKRRQRARARLHDALKKK